MDDFSIWLVDGKSTPEVAVVRYLESFFLGNIFKRKNIGDGLVAEPNFAVSFKVGFHVGGQFATIAHDCHAVIHSTDILDQSSVAKQIDGRLVVE